jgi:ATP-dependent protease ClpP protease subunit
VRRDPSSSPILFEARTETKNGQVRGALYLYDAIGGWDGITPKDVVSKLDELRAAGAAALDVYVNSPGGDVFDGMAIHAEISRWDRGEKVVTVDGLGASIASAIAMAGDRVVLSPHAMLMVHNPRTIALGDPAQLRKTADNLEAIRGVLIGVYAARTGLERDEIGKLMDAETWLTADEAVAKKFADEIASAPEQGDAVPRAARADLKVTAVHFDRPIPAQAFAAWNMAGTNKKPSNQEQIMSTDNAASLALSTALAELGLPSDATPAQITARCLQLKQPSGVSLAEFEALKAQVAERNAQDAVAKAQAEHKLTATGTPMHIWALDAARKAPEFFAAWAQAAPALIPELKQPAPPKDTAAADLTPEEIVACQSAGMTVAEYIAANKRGDEILKGSPLKAGGAK